MYVKLFSQILDSSIANDYKTRHLFQDMLLLSDQYGRVDMTVESIARRTGVPLPEVFDAIAKLMAPDTGSRTPDHDGRRLILLDAHRDWGWKIVNYEKYRSITNRQDQMEALGPERQNASGHIYYVLDPNVNRIKIGFSTNPWARLAALATVVPEVLLLATERGALRNEKERHKKFEALHIDKEWFKYEGELKSYIATLKPATRSTTSRKKVATVAPKAEAEAEAEADTKTERVARRSAPAKLPFNPIKIWIDQFCKIHHRKSENVPVNGKEAGQLMTFAKECKTEERFTGAVKAYLLSQQRQYAEKEWPVWGLLGARARWLHEGTPQIVIAEPEESESTLTFEQLLGDPTQ